MPLTLLGFFTSQVGATQVLQYVAVPGSYHGCIPVDQAGNGNYFAAPQVTQSFGIAKAPTQFTVAPQTFASSRHRTPL